MKKSYKACLKTQFYWCIFFLQLFSMVPVVWFVVRLVVVYRMVRMSGIFDMGNIPLITVHIVSHSLETAIRQVDMVFPGCVFATPLLAVAKVGFVVVPMYFVAKTVVSGVMVIMTISMTMSMVTVMMIGTG